jgi:proteasome lid subunit RPN8/RPN11
VTDVLYECSSWINGCSVRARDDKQPVDTTEKVYALVHEGLAQSPQEICLVILLDVHFCVRDVVEVAKGQKSKVAVDKSDVMAEVLKSRASYFILVHSHPGGKAKPSKADLGFTRQLEKASRLFENETKYLDHVVIARGECYSIRSKKLHTFAPAVKLVKPKGVHQIGMQVPPGGSNCAKCKFLRNGNACANAMWVNAPKSHGGGGGDPKLPCSAEIYCCDGFECL